MRVVLALFAYALATLGELLGPGGVKTVVAENLLLRILSYRSKMLVTTSACQSGPTRNLGITRGHQADEFLVGLRLFRRVQKPQARSQRGQRRQQAQRL